MKDLAGRTLMAFFLGVFAGCGNDLRFDDFDIERSIGVVAGERVDALVKMERLFDGGRMRLANPIGDVSPEDFKGVPTHGFAFDCVRVDPANLMVTLVVASRFFDDLKTAEECQRRIEESICRSAGYRGMEEGRTMPRDILRSFRVQRVGSAGGRVDVNLFRREKRYEIRIVETADPAVPRLPVRRVNDDLGGEERKQLAVLSNTLHEGMLLDSHDVDLFCRCVESVGGEKRAHLIENIGYEIDGRLLRDEIEFVNRSRRVIALGDDDSQRWVEHLTAFCRLARMVAEHRVETGDHRNSRRTTSCDDFNLERYVGEILMRCRVWSGTWSRGSREIAALIECWRKFVDSRDSLSYRSAWFVAKSCLQTYYDGFTINRRDAILDARRIVIDKCGFRPSWIDDIK